MSDNIELISERRTRKLRELSDAEWDANDERRIKIITSELAELDRLEEMGQLYCCNF